MKNPIEFKQNELIKSMYSGKVYRLISENRGMAKLENLNTGRIEDWNSCNNSHFIKQEPQLQLL